MAYVLSLELYSGMTRHACVAKMGDFYEQIITPGIWGVGRHKN
jgi:hypothetical protein